VLRETSPYPWGVADARLAALSGVTVAGLASAFEMLWYQAPRGRWLRRQPMLVSLLLRTTILTSLIGLGLVLNHWLDMQLGGNMIDEPWPFFNLLRDVAFSLVVMVAFIFVLQTSALVGARTLRNFLVGRYFRPVEEERIFLFLDMKGSTGVARKLGNARFHTFLSDAFFVLDSAIVDHGGEIVSYVGDSLIATWPLAGPNGNARVLLAVRDGFARLAAEGARFERAFGARPEFRAVVHGGPVVVGECGDSKRQITYLGDVLNVTARLEEVAKQQHIDIAVAGTLRARIALPGGFVAIPLGALPLRGVAEPLEVFEIRIG
jgi:adenylate cyclase